MHSFRHKNKAFPLANLRNINLLLTSLSKTLNLDKYCNFYLCSIYVLIHILILTKSNVKVF